MKQLAVISGKGGTGKTSLAACLAAIEKGMGPEHPVIVDCDVESPNLHLLLGGSPTASEPFPGPPIAAIDWTRVADRARCERSCPFGAIGSTGVDPLRCIGCGVCALVCGEAAVRMEGRIAGTIHERQTPYGRFFHAELLPGHPGSGGLVTALRARGEAAALSSPGALLILDGSPGIGCPVIASLTGCDLAVIVTEPGRGALHDLERLRRLLAHFRIGAMVVLNRCDTDRNLARETERYCAGHALPLAGSIPFHPAFIDAAVAGRPAVEGAEAGLAARLQEIHRRIRQALAGG